MSKLPIKTRLRVRKHTYELVTDLVYRVELILMGKKKEFGKLQPSTAEALSKLLSAARTAKIELDAYSDESGHLFRFVSDTDPTISDSCRSEATLVGEQ